MSGKLGHSKDLFILSVSVDDFCRLSFSFKTRTIHLPRDAEGGRKTCDVWLGFAREMSEGRVWSVGNKPGPRRWRRDVCSPSLSSDAGGAGRGSACAGPSHLSRVTTARGETCELWQQQVNCWHGMMDIRILRESPCFEFQWILTLSRDAGWYLTLTAINQLKAV